MQYIRFIYSPRQACENCVYGTMFLLPCSILCTTESLDPLTVAHSSYRLWKESPLGLPGRAGGAGLVLLDELTVLHVKRTDTTRIMNNEPEHLHNYTANILISVNFCRLISHSSLQICINQCIFWHERINSIHILKCQLSNPSAEILRWSSQENRSEHCSDKCNSAHAWPWYSEFKPPDTLSVRPEGLSQLKSLMISLGTESTTFRLIT
jgi:hypothetical protein